MSKETKQTKASVAFMIPHKHKKQLADLGYSADAISNMKPEEAHEILKAASLEPVKPTTDTTTADAISSVKGPEPKAKDPELAVLKSKLDLAWAKNQGSRQQEAEVRERWTESTHELINILGDARKRFPSDQAFGAWLTEAGYGEDRISRDDRSALLNMGLHPDVTREVLEQTSRHSWQLIWREEVQSRLRNATQPGSGDPANGDGKTRRPKRRKRGKKGDGQQEPEHLRDIRGWFNNQLASVNAVINELTKVMENSTPEQHQNLRKTAEPNLLVEAIEKLQQRCDKFHDWLALDEAADALIKDGRVKVTPGRRRASAPIQPSA
jgi:hypothetical protein